MSSEKQHSPQHEELLKKQSLEQQEVKEVLVFIQKFAKPAAIVLVVVCALVLGDRFFKSQRHKKEIAADAALSRANSPEALQAIWDDYASTPSGPIALMELAKQKFNANQIDEAQTLYTTFTEKFSTHELAPQAELNLISCIEAQDRFGDAHLLYTEFAANNTGSFLEPAAMTGKARCLEALDQLTEAQIAYEDIIVNFPESDWAQLAEANLKVILNKKQ